MFTSAILKLPELPPDPKDQRIYDLAPLMHKTFEFTYDVGSGIDKVVVKKLRLSSRSKKGERIALEADTTKKPEAVYDLLAKISASLPLNDYSVTQVDLAVTLAPEGDKLGKVANVRITYPNSCSLKYDALDLKLRDMLSASGIEPKEPIATAVDPVAASAA